MSSRPIGPRSSSGPCPRTPPRGRARCPRGARAAPYSGSTCGFPTCWSRASSGAPSSAAGSSASTRSGRRRCRASATWCRSTRARGPARTGRGAWAAPRPSRSLPTATGRPLPAGARSRSSGTRATTGRSTRTRSGLSSRASPSSPAPPRARTAMPRSRWPGPRSGSGAWTHRIVAPAILLKFGRLEKGIDRTLIDGAANLPYAIPNVLVDQVAVDLLPVPRGFWRSVGISQNAFVTECFCDEVAVAAGKDPYEFRRALLGDKPRHRRTLELAAENAGSTSHLTARQGRGIALAEWAPTTCAQVAEVSVAPDGTVRVHRVVCAVDCGPVVNPDTIEAQLQGGIVYGLTAALYGEITIERGRVKQS